MIATSAACCYVYVNLAERYRSQKVQTTVSDSMYPVFMIPFPSIGICPRYRIDWQRLHEEAPKRFLPPDASNQTLETFYEFFDKIADFQFVTANYLKPLFDAEPSVNLSLIDNVDVMEVMQFLAVPCQDMFISCKWRTKTYPCCDLFHLQRTEAGFCYVFNSLLTPGAKESVVNNHYFPYRTPNSGEGTGLQVRIGIDLQKMNPEYKYVNGIYIMIKQPGQWHADLKFVNLETFTKISVLSHVTETGEATRAIAPKLRRCLFQDETDEPLYRNIPGFQYWRGNCRTRCHQGHLLKYCKCNLHLSFPNTTADNYTNCKPSNFRCIYQNAHVFSREREFFGNKFDDYIYNDSMKCDCLNSCNQLIFDGFFNSVPMEGSDPESNVKYVFLDVHFQSSFMLKYYTSIRYTFVELLASFGGIIGLFLGASLLSAVELVYYFTIGLYARFHQSSQAEHKEFSNNSAHKTTRPVKWRVIKLPQINDDKSYKY